MIRIPQVRVVDEEGNQLGVMPTPQALEMAQERGLDLVEVAPMAAPPVVRFLDFGQYKYELTKREKENKRRQRSVTFKEVRLSPKIGVGDFQTKVHRAIEFLEDGDRIKVTVRFRGRELTHPELGRNLLTKFTEQVQEHGVIERAPLLEGKSMFITMASTHKPKSHEGGGHAKPAAGTTAPKADGATAAVQTGATADSGAEAQAEAPGAKAASMDKTVPAKAATTKKTAAPARAKARAADKTEAVTPAEPAAPAATDQPA